VAANYRLIAVQVGDALKYQTTVNEINRIAGAIFPFRYENFPNEAITSSRAKLVHDWILSLAKQQMAEAERDGLLKSFCAQLCSDDVLQNTIDPILEAAGLETGAKMKFREFLERGFHPEVVSHCRTLFGLGHSRKLTHFCSKELPHVVRSTSASSSQPFGCRFSSSI
jgi:hypothetical protein